MAAISERVELAKLCSSRDWSKAIRVLDSLLSNSSSIQDICNRAFCYSQLELHKHVVKDCDRALQLDPALLQPYILKGRAFSALGRKEDAILVWEQGYEHALRQSADLKQLLELKELLSTAEQEKGENKNHATEAVSATLLSESRPHVNGISSETCTDQSNLSDQSQLHSESTTEVHSKSNDNMCNGEVDKAKGKKKFDSQTNGNHDSSRESPSTSEVQSKSIENRCIGAKARGKKKSDSQMNENHDTDRKLSNESEACNDLSDRCNKLPLICSKSSDLAESPLTPPKLSSKSEMSDESKKNKKFCFTRISKSKSISVDFRLSRGIAEVNEGKYTHAISIFDQILKEDPNYPEALIGRGTAYAFQRELMAAIADFTKAMETNPSAAEAWKRRGQARAALGEFTEAIEDLSKALEFEPNSADILHERGIANFKFKDFYTAVEDLSACVKLDKGNTSAYTYLGLALSSIGEYKRAEEAHLKAIQLDRNFLEAWVQLTQFYQDMANPNKAFECLHQALQIDGRFAKAYHLRGLLLHGMGEHSKAIKELSTGLNIESANIECLYLRASCYHAIGEYKPAVKDYDAVLDLELDSMEKFVLQCLAFYQKEIALYTASKLNSEFVCFDIDGDIDSLFKEYWCKRLHPKNVCEKVYRQPPLRESLKKNKLKKLDFSVTKQSTALLQAADCIGEKIQYDCPGFLPNRRQHRMAGLAAIEVAQKVSKAWRSFQAEWKYSNKSTSKNGKRPRRRERINLQSQNRGGAGCSTSSSSDTTSYGITQSKSTGRFMMSWHDVYSVAVKWRQISEPCDPVVWINKLSEEFNAGFGSHTPIILGQARVVRYFPNFERTFDVAKTIMNDRKYVHNKADGLIDLSREGKLRDVVHAKSCADLYKAVGEDFWLATWCNSAAFEGKYLEGTRITLVKLAEQKYDFAIRTPCTPARWDEFDAEMAMAWEDICNAYCGENYGSTDFNVLEKVRDAILRMTYYWYNFMPLSRGSAAVGFVVMLGLFLAANMEFTGTIPQGLQVDWEVKKQILFALLGGLSLILLVHAQDEDQSGFISIDCGRTENSNYTEKTTGINYISDTGFVDTGESKLVLRYVKDFYQQPYWGVRSFPEGIRNCYKINVTTGDKYLIRVSFVYGNYDGKGMLPTFLLYLGTNLWDSVKVQNESYAINKELIHVAPRNYIHVCLVNDGSGVPFISAIELRPLNVTSYPTQIGSLALNWRLDIGQTGPDLKYYRYPKDIHDRFWDPYEDVHNKWFTLNTSSTVDFDNHNLYEPASVVMSTAATAKNATDPLMLWWDPPVDANDTEYYVYMHFAELEKLQPNESRWQYITNNGELYMKSFAPRYLYTDTIYNRFPLRGSQNFSIIKAENSTLPPSINGLEIYTLKEFLELETNQDDVEAIINIKSAYEITKNWQGDPCLSLNYSWEGIKCNYPQSDSPRIISLDLSSSGLTGEISPSISNLAMIKTLDLSNNNLTGPIPDFLSQLRDLNILNLENNKFTGSLPLGLTEKLNNDLLTISLCDNPNLAGSEPCETKKKKNKIIIPIIGAIAGISALILAGAVFLCFCKRKRKNVVAMDPKPNPGSVELEQKTRKFTYSEILKITNNRQRVLGKGGFGTVYHGYIDDKTQVAVKMLSQTSSQGLQQFHAEVHLLMRVHHTNLTSLVGYCDDELNKGLVYEYMANGNLQAYLSDKTSDVLTWEGRLQIATEAAQGLEYLHYGCKPPMIHRDVKSTNILLSEKFQAKLSDFGLSRNFAPGDGTHIVTGVAGTPGYLAPEYHQSNRLNEKSDVYSFGIVLLEIITGRPVYARTNGERTHITRWVELMLPRGDIYSIIDPMLERNFNVNSAWKAVETAMACVSAEPSKRPVMSTVVMELKECLASQLDLTNFNSYETELGSSSIDVSQNNSIIMMRPSVR